jgi:hypothetical protein
MTMDPELRECISCGGPLVLDGSIGFLEWYHCRRCGQAQSREVGEYEPDEDDDDSDDDEDDEADSAPPEPPAAPAESPPPAEAGPLSWLRDATEPGVGFSIFGVSRRRRRRRDGGPPPTG